MADIIYTTPPESQQKSGSGIGSVLLGLGLVGAGLLWILSKKNKNSESSGSGGGGYTETVTGGDEPTEAAGISEQGVGTETETPILDLFKETQNSGGGVSYPTGYNPSTGIYGDYLNSSVLTAEEKSALTADLQTQVPVLELSSTPATASAMTTATTEAASSPMFSNVGETVVTLAGLVVDTVVSAFAPTTNTQKSTNITTTARSNSAVNSKYTSASSGSSGSSTSKSSENAVSTYTATTGSSGSSASTSTKSSGNARTNSAVNSKYTSTTSGSSGSSTSKSSENAVSTYVVGKSNEKPRGYGVVH